MLLKKVRSIVKIKWFLYLYKVRKLEKLLVKQLIEIVNLRVLLSKFLC